MGRRKRGAIIDGWINLDKPVGLTSTEALGKLKRILDPRKAGHAGTLDPLARGVLPVALGEATKTIPWLQDRLKTYDFTVRWGIATTTDDAEGEPVATADHRPDAEAIRAALPRFIGEIEQTPPIYSAIKVDGARAYDLARAGEAVALKPRLVEVDDLQLADIIDADHARFEITSGKGFYVRALARDLAEALGTRGHVVALTRTGVGGFSLDDSVTLEELSAGDDPLTALLPVDAALDDIPAVRLSEQEAHRLQQGQPVGLLKRSDLERLAAMRAEAGPDGLVRVTAAGRFIALACLEGAELKPVRIFN